MCGRFNLRTPAAQLAAFFDIVFDPPLQAALAPRFNIAPSQPVLIVHGQAGRIAANLVCWGLVPGWAKDPAIGNRMINARGETVAEKPSFRAAFRHRRCLVPATGFYEWQRLGGQQKQPWHIHHPDNRPLAFAGIWENWEGPDGSSLQTCAIITTEANSRMAPIHHRMPVILRPDDFATWLDPQSDHHDQLESLLVPCPDETLVTSPIDAWVNRPANEGPDCLRPASDPTPTDGRLFE